MATVRERRKNGVSTGGVMTVRQRRRGQENKQYADLMQGSREMEIANLSKQKEEPITPKSVAPKKVAKKKKGFLDKAIGVLGNLAGTKETFKEDTTGYVGRNSPVIGRGLRNLDKLAEVTKPAADFTLENLYTPGAGLGVLNSATRSAGALVSRLAPGLGKTLGGRVAKVAAQEAIVGAPAGVGNQLARDPQSSDRQLLEAGAFGAGGSALLGGAAEALAPVLGKAFKSFMNRGRTAAPEVEQRVTEMLALPAPRQRGNLTAVESPDVIYGSGRVHTPEPLALPAGQSVPRTRLRVAGNDQTLNRVMERIKPVVTERMTPPLENPNELAKWVQSHLGTEISLNEVRTLPYEDLRQMAEMMRGRLNMSDEAHKVARELGYDLPTLLEGRAPTLREAAQRTRQAEAYGVYPDELPNVRTPQFSRQVVSGAAAPVERVGRAAAESVPETPMTVRARRETQQPIITQEATQAPVQVIRQEAPTSEQPVVRRQETPGIQERGFAQTLNESDKTPQGFKERLRSAYTPLTNEQTLVQANKRINKDVEEATSFVLGKSRFDDQKATVAMRLIDHYNAKGDYQRSVDIAERVSEDATRAGQGNQALSMFDRLSPEGVLIFAQRKARKVNEGGTIFTAEARVTPEMAENITGLAQATQKMTGVKDLSNNVMDILERAKAGEKLSDTDAQALKRFVNESKQFVKETAKPPKPPKAPQQPKDKRVRDNVASFLDAQEQAAKERLRARGIRISSTPLDVWADYAIIGAAKMGKGTIKFADWSEQMAKDLGEDIRPHLNQLYDRAREAYEASTKKVTQQTISQAERLTEKFVSSKELKPGEIDSLRTLAQKVSGLSGDAKELASQDLQAMIQGLERPTTLKRIATTQTIGQLLNPKTQVRNSLGNELFYRLERLNKLISTPIDIARSKITGGERTVTFRTNNQGEYWANWMRGLKAGWKGVNVKGLETQYDIGSPAFKSKYNPLTYLEKALGASLKSFDTAAYMRAYNNTVGEMATLRAVNEGQSGNKALIQKYIREADDNVMKIADEYGKYVTFQDNNVISRGLVAVKKGLNFKKDFGLGDLIIKYPKTPGALLHRALEYSPAGFLRSAAILARPLFKKEANTAEVTQALTRAIIGTTGLSGMGYFLLDKGILTGSASKDKDIRELQKSAGQGQYQVNLSALMRLVKGGFDSKVSLKEDDYLYTYDWMQPLSMAVSIGANTAKNLNEGKEGLSGLAGTAYNSLEGGLGTLTEQSVLQGLKRAAEGYPGQTVTDKIIDILSDIPSSFVPTASNQIKQLGDNARRETYSPNKLDASINRAQAKIPGLAEKLPKQYDTLGREKETYQDNNPFNVMFNPGFGSRYKLSPEAKYIVELIAESGDESLAPRVPEKTITIDGQLIKLNGDMFSRIQQLQGEETRSRIESRITRDAGKKLETRSKKVSEALTDAGKAARKQLEKEMGR